MKNEIQFKERITDETERKDLTKLLFELPIEVVSEKNPNENPDLVVDRDPINSRIYVAERLTTFYHVQTLERAKRVKVDYSKEDFSSIRRLSLSYIQDGRDSFVIGLLDNRLHACNFIIHKFYW